MTLRPSRPRRRRHTGHDTQDRGAREPHGCRGVGQQEFHRDQRPFFARCVTHGELRRCPCRSRSFRIRSSIRCARISRVRTASPCPSGEEFGPASDVDAEKALTHQLVLLPGKEGMFMVTVAVETDQRRGQHRPDLFDSRNSRPDPAGRGTSPGRRSSGPGPNPPNSSRTAKTGSRFTRAPKARTYHAIWSPHCIVMSNPAEGTPPPQSADSSCLLREQRRDAPARAWM